MALIEQLVKESPYLAQKVGLVKRGNPNWIKGVSANPGGGAKTKGMQDPGPRTKLLLQEHGVVKILAAMKDETVLAEFAAYDAMLIMGLANSLKGSDTARESMLNRMFGKVPDKQINLNLNVDVDPENLSSRAGEMLASLGADESDLIEE